MSELFVKPKPLVCKLLGYNKGVSVTRGRGTAHGWLHIVTPEPVPQKMRDRIEEELLLHKLCGTYACDQPGIDKRDACVCWQMRHENGLVY